MKLRDLDKIIPAPDLLELLRAAGYDHSCVHHACYKSFSYLTFTKLLVEYLRPEERPTIGELKDMYTIAQHVGIPGTKIDAFVKTAAMAGYIFVRAATEPQGERS